MYDHGYIRSEHISGETNSGIRHLRLFTRDGKVSSVTVDMGHALLDTESISARATYSTMINTEFVRVVNTRTCVCALGNRAAGRH